MSKVVPRRSRSTHEPSIYEREVDRLALVVALLAGHGRCSDKPFPKLCCILQLREQRDMDGIQVRGELRVLEGLHDQGRDQLRAMKPVPGTIGRLVVIAASLHTTSSNSLLPL